jgi:hypothetical protein
MQNPSAKPAAMLVLIGLAACLIFVPACKHKSKNYDAFAKCLAAKPVVMYGLYWCEHCADQKKEFGSSFQYVQYVECGIKGSRAEAPACIEAGVKNFPAWKFPDGSVIEGVRPLEFLSEKSECPLQ